MKLSLAWINNPTRTIHIVVSVLAVVGAVIADVTNALNGSETWVAVGIAVLNVIQGEVNRTQVSPASKKAASVATTGTVN